MVIYYLKYNNNLDVAKHHSAGDYLVATCQIKVSTH
jgi:hypothetical protein